MVIPVHDTNPVRRTPVVTYLLIAVNVGVFLLTPTSRTSVIGGQGIASVCHQEAFYDQYAAIPKEVTSEQPLSLVPTGQVGYTPDGRVGCVLDRPSYHKEPALSVLFAMFLHGGWLHLLGNMLFLYVFGNNVEDRMGRLGYLIFYLACGYAATYGFAYASPGSTTALLGASGAIAGVLGAYIVLYPRAKVITLLPFLFFIPARLPAWAVLGFWFVLQYLYTQGVAVSGAGDVAYLAHVIGFLLGVAVGLPLRLRRPPARAGPRWPAYRPRGR